MRILVIQLRQLGDIILTTPALSALRKSHPRSEIIFLSHKMGRLVLKGNSDISEHWIYEEGVREFLVLMKRIRQKKFDVLVDFLCNPRSAYISLFSGAGKKIGFSGVRQHAYNITVPRHFPKNSPYIATQKIAMLSAADLIHDPALPKLKLEITAEDKKLVSEFAADHTDWLNAPVRWAISATHRRKARLWPASCYAQISDFISLNYGGVVVWLWGPGEKEYVEQIRETCQKSKGLMLPPTTFLQMTAFIGACDFMLSGSNGPSHAAVAMDITTLQLHGPTEPEAWSPENERHQTLCPADRISGKKSLEISDISVQEVKEKIASMWSIIEDQAKRRKAGVSSASV